jgi:2-methylcitrate dehydratase PrpD
MTATMSHSESLSRFTSGLRFQDLPGPVVESAKRHLIDVIGVGLIGSRQDVARRAVEGLRAVPGAEGDACVWGTQARLAPPFAALANGISAHVLDFDDTHTDSITHGSAVLGPVVLALGDALDSSGRDMIAAFAAGWETTARVGLAARGSFHKRGFHTTSVAGIFGGTVAAARLLGLSESSTAHAVGLALSQVSGVSEYLSNGSSAKSFHPGWAAHSAILASYLAGAGMTGPMTAFEGRYGLFRTHGLPDDSDLEQLIAGLGERWETSRISIKPYPCCHFAHAFIDCALALRRAGLGLRDIARVECVVPEIELPLICEPFAQKLRPDSPYAAKFSLPFVVAAALADGRVGHETFTPENIKRPELLAFAQRVTYRTAKPGETTFPKYFPGWMHGTHTDGGTFEERLDVNRGNPDNPLPADAVEAKFRDNARGVLADDAAARCFDILMSLDDHRARDVIRLLRPGTAAEDHDPSVAEARRSAAV